MSINICVYYSIIRKRRKDKTYENPEAAETEVHPYQNIPDNRSREITHPYQNIPDNRSGEITHQPKQNNEVVHQENDPYTIIDNDIIKPSNGIQGMEYLEDDLYISSGDVTDDAEVDDKLKTQLPVVAEYAQVNKSNANKNTNRNYKTGPKGDNYAVVNKGGKMINNDKQFKIGPSGDQYTVVNRVGEGSTNN
ncbi:hypothetical protein SNE40_013499 [Patella caerulea]|uniref:Uncharacterized protein n=1 Tax=Patella caerulea TaxID=87958 RepID=A0AAN8JBQ8_PATCE